MTIRLSILLGCLILFACGKETLKEQSFFVVTTLPADNVRLGQAQLKARIEGQTESIVLEHGFYLSKNKGAIENLDSNEISTIIFNKNINALSADYDTLLNKLPEGKFYFQAFAHLGKRSVVGEIRDFSTEIDLYIKLDTVFNNTAQISGIISGLQRLEGSVEEHGIVITCDANNPPSVENGDSTISNGPAFQDGSFAVTFDKLKFNTTYYASPYIKLNGVITQGAVIPITIADGWQLNNGALSGDQYGLSRTVAITTETDAYFGVGCRQAIACDQTNNNINFYKYEVNQNGFGQSVPIGKFLHPYRQDAIAFEINGVIYLGLGVTVDDSGVNTYHTDFWTYSFEEKKFKPFDTPFKGVGRRGAVAFVWNDKAYIGTGQDAQNNYLPDFYEFNPADNTWKEIDSVKIAINGTQITRGRVNALAFVVKGRAFYGLGYSVLKPTDFWELDQATLTWKLVTENVEGIDRQGAKGFALENGRYYFGGGLKGNEGTKPEDFLTDFWEFDPDRPVPFQRVSSLPASGRAYGVAFTINGKGYFGTGENHQTAFNDLWEYIPKE